MILLFALVLLALVLTGFDALHGADTSPELFDRDPDAKTGVADPRDSLKR